MPNLSNTDSVRNVNFVVRGRRVLATEGQRAASIHIRGGVIAKIASFEDIPGDQTVYDARCV